MILTFFIRLFNLLGFFAYILIMCICFLCVVTEKNDDDATTLNLHPAEIYLRMEAKAREKKLNRWIKSQQKPIKKKKPSKLQAAIKRKLRAMKPDQEEEFSDDDILDDLDYDNFNVTFDPEKSPKFNC